MNADLAGTVYLACSVLILVASVLAAYVRHRLSRLEQNALRDIWDRDEFTADRRRMGLRVARDGEFVMTHQKRYSKGRGWVWLAMAPLPPRRDRRPEDNHLERSGWALTERRAAKQVAAARWRLLESMKFQAELQPPRQSARDAI